MFNNTNPDSPVAGNWLANTYAPEQAPVYSVGYAPVNPFAAQDPSRRSMVNNPAFGMPMYGQAPVTQDQQIMPFSSYPPAVSSTPATSSLNQLAFNTTTNGNTAAVTQNNPWAANTTPTPFVAPMANPTVAAPSFGFGTMTPTIQTEMFNGITAAWDKKSGSPWPQTQCMVPQAPSAINWSGSVNTSNGYYAPTAAGTLQPQYPTQYNTTPVNSDWSAICETNFKQQI